MEDLVNSVTLYGRNAAARWHDGIRQDFSLSNPCPFSTGRGARDVCLAGRYIAVPWAMALIFECPRL